VSRAFRFTPALGAVLFAVIGLSACGGIPGNAVLQIDGKSLTKATFTHWMTVASVASNPGAAGAKPVLPEPPSYAACIAHLRATTPASTQAPTQAVLKSQCEQQYKTLQQEVLGFLITSQWVLGEAEALGVKVSDKEVKQRFAQIRSTQFPTPGAFEKFLASSGQTVSDLLVRVKGNIVAQKIQQKVAKRKPNITQAQIAKYYKENPQRFGVPEKRSVEVILAKNEAAANKAKQEVASGKSFASVAKRVSIDPTSKASGGLLPQVVKGQEEKSLDTAIFTAQPNVLSGPVKTVFGYYVFEVKGITSGNQLTLAQAQSTIKQQLTASQQQSALANFVKNFKKKWVAKTDCRGGYVVMDCKQYKAPKTPSNATPVTPQTSAPTQTSTAPATTPKK
jgi:foldase protein PrsA